MTRIFINLEEKRPENNLKTYSAFSDTINSFVPDTEMLFYLAQGFVIFGKDADPEATPNKFSIFAEYEYSAKKVIEKNDN